MARRAPRRLTVRPGAGAAAPYDLIVRPGALEALAGIAADVAASGVAVIADARVAELHGDRLRRALPDGGRVEFYLVPPGEASKTPETVVDLTRRLVRAGFDRRALVVAFGGGVVGDLAGFVAASFLRGVPFVNAPTSHLAMVDASIGGKTGVNLPEGKNLMGAFWQPHAVLADVDTLRTLPRRIFRQGAVETIKHGLLADASLLDLLDEPGFAPEGPADVLAEAVLRSAAVKARIVEADTLERGVRAHLNLGHTLAHALEKASDHGLAHGDAVAYGLLFAAHLSEARGARGVVDPARRLLTWLEPNPLPPADLDELDPYLARDKKAEHGRRRWVLLEAPQRPQLVDDVAAAELRDAWTALHRDVAALAKETR